MNIRIIMTQYGLCIQFRDQNTKNTFLEQMKAKCIEFFTEEDGPHCYIKPYSDEYPTGQFVSAERRIGLAFPSEKLKFYFKEYIGLPSNCFMDMGPGYEAQMHFNTEILPLEEGAFIVI